MLIIWHDICHNIFNQCARKILLCIIIPSTNHIDYSITLRYIFLYQNMKYLSKNLIKIIYAFRSHVIKVTLTLNSIFIDVDLSSYLFEFFLDLLHVVINWHTSFEVCHHHINFFGRFIWKLCILETIALSIFIKCNIWSKLLHLDTSKHLY